MIFRFWQPRTIYGCGNCRRSFKSQATRDAHYDANGDCPQVAMERDLARHNADVMRLVEERNLIDTSIPEGQVGHVRSRFRVENSQPDAGAE